MNNDIRTIIDKLDQINEESATALQQHHTGHYVVHKKSGNRLGTIHAPTINRNSHVAIVNGPKGSDERLEFPSFKHAHNHIRQVYGIDDLEEDITESTGKVDLRKLIEHIDRGGETIRELDPRTGRVVTRPVIEGEIGRKIGSTIGGVFGKSAGDRLGQIGSNIGDMFDKPSSDKPMTTQKGPGNISDFSGGPDANKDSSSAGTPSIAGQNADGSFNSDHPFVLAMNKKVAANKNPNGNNGHDGSNIDPNDDPTDPKTWPSGVKSAADFGFIDSNNMWIPTPFHIRTESGDWKVPRNSPANLVGIPHNKYTPFQLKFEKMQEKVVYLSSSAIEQTRSVKLPSGAPDIPGYKPIDPKRFSTDASGPGVNKNLDWVYAYQNGKHFILIAPDLFYNTKISIGRYYNGWLDNGIRSDNDKVPSANGPVYVSAAHFNADDKILSVVVHISVGAPNIGAQLLKSISSSLKPA